MPVSAVTGYDYSAAAAVSPQLLQEAMVTVLQEDEFQKYTGGFGGCIM